MLLSLAWPYAGHARMWFMQLCLDAIETLISPTKAYAILQR